MAQLPYGRAGFGQYSERPPRPKHEHPEHNQAEQRRHAGSKQPQGADGQEGPDDDFKSKGERCSRSPSQQWDVPKRAGEVSAHGPAHVVQHVYGRHQLTDGSSSDDAERTQQHEWYRDAILTTMLTTP